MKDWKAAVRTWEKKDGFVYTEKKQEIKTEPEEFDRFAVLPPEFVKYLHSINAIDGQTLDYSDLTDEDVKIISEYGV